MSVRLKKIKPGVEKIKGWRFNEKKGIHHVTKRESAFGGVDGITQRFDKK